MEKLDSKFIYLKIQDLTRSINLEKSELRRLKDLSEDKKSDMLDSINIKKQRLKELRLELLKSIGTRITKKHK